MAKIMVNIFVRASIYFSVYPLYSKMAYLEGQSCLIYSTAEGLRRGIYCTYCSALVLSSGLAYLFSIAGFADVASFLETG